MRVLIILAAISTVTMAAPGVLPLDIRDRYDRNRDCPRVPITHDGRLPKSSSPPHVIAYVSRKDPKRVFGSARSMGKITPGDLCTAAEFKVEYKPGRKCGLVFCFPSYGQLGNDDRDLYTLRGPGNLSRVSYAPNIRIYPEKVNWANLPTVGLVESSRWEPGKCYVLREYEPVPEPKKGEKYTYLSGVTCSEDTDFSWKQSKARGDGYACPLGHFHMTLD